MIVLLRNGDASSTSTGVVLPSHYLIIMRDVETRIETRNDHYAYTIIPTNMGKKGKGATVKVLSLQDLLDLVAQDNLCTEG